MKFEEVVEIIEISWRAACEADMGVVPSGMSAGVDQFGNPAVNTIRLNTYFAVLNALLPRSRQSIDSTVTVAQPREPWQRSDDE